MTGASQLVSSLITAPPARRGAIRRARLATRLDAAARHRLTLVRAPAGFGKTTAVAAWLAERRRAGDPVAWVSLDARHDDPGTLLRYVVAALRGAWPGVGEATLTLLNAGVPVSHQTLVATLANELGALTRDAFLVLDDAHCLAGAAARDALRELVGHAPGTLHFVLTTRESPALPVARLRQQGELLELDAADLEFSAEEVETFLAHEALPVSAADAQSIAARTGGWAAALRLAAIALREQADPVRFMASFSGERADVADFLQEDVLARQPDALQDFLLGAGTLEELSAAMCDDVLERSDSHRMIALAEDKGLFLFSVDAIRERYRFHQLFGDFLRRQLARTDAARAQHIAARASAWHAGREEAREAVTYALRAEDPALAGELLERFSETLFAQGQLDWLRALGERLPGEVLDCSPRFALDLVWIHTLSWEMRDAARLLARVRAHVDALDEAEVPASLHEKILHRELMLALLQDRLGDAERMWARWPLVSTGENDYFDGSAETTALLVERERFGCRYVLDTAPRVRRLFVDAGTEYGTVWFDSIVGPAEFERGETATAVATLSGAAATAARVCGPDAAVCAMPSLLLAEVLLERDETDDARTLVERWLPLADRIGFVDQLVAGYVSAARLAALDGEPERALALLDEGDALARAYGFERLAAHLACERVARLAALGRAQEASALTLTHPAFTTRALAPPGRLATLTDSALVRARVRAMTAADDAQGLPDGVLRMLRAWTAHAEGHGCVREAIRLRATQASLLTAHGRARDAWRALRGAVAQAQAGGIVRPLLEERDTLEALLAATGTEDALAGDTLAMTLADLGARLDPGTRHAAPAARPGARGPVDVRLTPRQLEILRAIADGSSNKEVALRLGLSEATVKWHLQHAYDALGVHRRVGAVRRARELGLLA